MEKIIVRLGERSYDILTGKGILPEIGGYIRKAGLGESVFILTSPRIGKLYLPILLRSLKKSGYKEINTAYLPDGEKYKCLDNYVRLMDRIAHLKTVKKKIFMINLGGGVIGDMGGFVAATYKRGIDYVQVPTTVVAMSDSGVGGKTGVDVSGAKNIAGAFHQPRLVYADVNLLKTLDNREYIAGLAEVIKYGVIKSPGLFILLEKNMPKLLAMDLELLQKIVSMSYRIKADIVSKDERDTKGIRAILNYGHTIGHAVEAASGYRLRHGEAISIGMACANDLAVKTGLLASEPAARIENLLIAAGLPVKITGIKPKDILGFLEYDKKFISSKKRFVLAAGIGKTALREVSDNSVIEVISGRVEA